MANPLSILPVKELVSRVITDVRFRTDFTDEKVILTDEDIADILIQKPKPKGGPPTMGSKVLGAIKPTFTINTPSGQRIYAPYGVSDPRSPSIFKNRVKLLLILTVGTIFFTGFGLGRLSKQ